MSLLWTPGHSWSRSRDGAWLALASDTPALLSPDSSSSAQAPGCPSRCPRFPPPSPCRSRSGAAPPSSARRARALTSPGRGLRCPVVSFRRSSPCPFLRRVAVWCVASSAVPCSVSLLFRCCAVCVPFLRRSSLPRLRGGRAPPALLSRRGLFLAGACPLCLPRSLARGRLASARGVPRAAAVLPGAAGPGGARSRRALPRAGSAVGLLPRPFPSRLARGRGVACLRLSGRA